MNYRRLGSSGLKVSELSLGSWVTYGNQMGDDPARECMAAAYDAGVNFFDNAEVYARGQSETIMGNALKKLGWRRSSYIVSTKFFWGLHDGPNEKTTLNRKYLLQAIDGSLRRLQLDYVDLVFCHRPDPETPIEETVWAMHDIIRAGKALYWGTSEWSAAEIMAAWQIAERHHLAKPVMEQPQYNLFHRDRVEKEYAQLYRDIGLGTTTWSPLASGLLTGKYNDGVPAGSRATLKGYEWLAERLVDPARIAKVRRLAPIAADLGCTLAQLALAWCLRNPNVSTVITGASRAAQVTENMRALDSRAEACRRGSGPSRRRARGLRPVSNPLESWTEEQRSAYLYRVCAEAEAGTPRADLFRRLAGEAEAQAAIWRAQLTASGKPAPQPFLPDARTRLVARMVRLFGPGRLRAVLAAMKVRGMAIYSRRDPGGHSAPIAGSVEHRHRGLGGGGNLRAAVFGVNDGLVSNASLIFGVAGANPDVAVVLLTGVAGLTAGAFAMATGEFVSVRSQRELFEYQIGLEREELAEYPDAEAQELALIYKAKGLSGSEAERVAKQLVSDPEHALDTLAREELGLNPDELGSPWGAAISSLLSFAVGAAIPLLPFVFGAGARALPITALLTAVALFGDRRDAVAVHRPRRDRLRLAHAAARRARRQRHVRGGQALRRRHLLM